MLNRLKGGVVHLFMQHMLKFQDLGKVLGT